MRRIILSVVVVVVAVANVDVVVVVTVLLWIVTPFQWRSAAAVSCDPSGRLSPWCPACTLESR